MIRPVFIWYLTLYIVNLVIHTDLALIKYNIFKSSFNPLMAVSAVTVQKPPPPPQIPVPAVTGC